VATALPVSSTTRERKRANFAPPNELAELDAISSKVEAADIPTSCRRKARAKLYTVDEVEALGRTI